MLCGFERILICRDVAQEQAEYRSMNESGIRETKILSDREHKPFQSGQYSDKPAVLAHRETCDAKSAP